MTLELTMIHVWNFVCILTIIKVMYSAFSCLKIKPKLKKITRISKFTFTNVNKVFFLISRFKWRNVHVSFQSGWFISRPTLTSEPLSVHKYISQQKNLARYTNFTTCRQVVLLSHPWRHAIPWYKLWFEVTKVITF